MSEYVTEIQEEVEADVAGLKTYFDDVKRVGRDIKNHEDRLDKKFYLEAQDVLSDAFDEINRAYLRVKAQTDIAEADPLRRYRRPRSHGVSHRGLRYGRKTFGRFCRMSSRPRNE